MARYVDGFVLPVPRANRAAYRRIARKAARIWLDHGALEYRECVAEDVKPGKRTSFPQSVKLRPDEEVWFSWIVFRSRRDRDRVNAKVMADPRLADMHPGMVPFDGKRLVYGGFEIAVDAPGALAGSGESTRKAHTTRKSRKAHTTRKAAASGVRRPSSGIRGPGRD